MTNTKCIVCGHVNRVGAAVCEMCDTRLGEPAEAGAADSSRTSEESSARYADSSAEDFGASAGGFEPGGAESREGAEPTSIPSPQFKGAGDVIYPTLAVYRKHFLLIGILVAVTTLPVVLVQLAAVRAATMTMDEAMMAESSLFAFSSAAALLIGLLSYAGSALLSGALVYAVIQIQLTGVATAGESLRRGLRVLPKVFVVSLLYFIVTMVGYLLLIIPGVIFSLKYAVAIPVAVAENRGVFESFTQSARLTEGYKGLIFLTHFLLGVLIVVANLVVTWSFAYGEAGDSVVALLVLSVIGGMLSASSVVLDVYIFLGLLRERGEGFQTRIFTPGPEAAAR